MFVNTALFLLPTCFFFLKDTEIKLINSIIKKISKTLAKKKKKKTTI